jgi:multimeric flavodoxin WrbA
MNITVINGSPHMGNGYTSQILAPLIKGMRNAKAEVTLLYSSKLKIKPCTGEFHCWFKKPGECILKDDMQSVYKNLADSDILILATQYIFHYQEKCKI